MSCVSHVELGTLSTKSLAFDRLISVACRVSSTQSVRKTINLRALTLLLSTKVMAST